MGGTLKKFKISGGIHIYYMKYNSALIFLNKIDGKTLRFLY